MPASHIFVFITQTSFIFDKKKCVFIGYSLNQQRYRCLDMSTGRIFHSCHVLFDEKYMPFKESTPAQPMTLPESSPILNIDPLPPYHHRTSHSLLIPHKLPIPYCLILTTIIPSPINTFYNPILHQPHALRAYISPNSSLIPSHSACHSRTFTYECNFILGFFLF